MLEKRRSEKRYIKKLATVATVTQCDDDPSLQGSPVKCETVNISVHGMQFRSDIELQPGTLLSISIAYKPSEIYSVGGEVRWCNVVDGVPTMGVQLHEDKGTDFESWLALLRADLEQVESE